MNLRSTSLLVVASLLLASCGGAGGGGPISTPNPTPSPTPAPTPTPTPPPSAHALGATTGVTNFANHDAGATQNQSLPDHLVTATTAASLPLSFSYDAASQTYRVSGGSSTSSFGAAQFEGMDAAGDANFSRGSGNDFERLTLINPARLGGGTQHVSAGLWQRRTASTATSANFAFDLFVYGYPTATSGVPTSGSATYDIDLIGVASPLGTFPRSVLGSGTFSLDFKQGLFAMSGEAGEYNNDVNYSVCCGLWRAAGYLASDGSLTGNFSLEGRDRFTYQAALVGDLFGPAGSEVGGRLVGGDGANATFTGVFAGTRDHDGINVVLSALDTGARQYFTSVGVSVVSHVPGAPNSSAAAYYFPASFGRINFGADGSITVPMGINDTRFQDVTFAQANLLAAQSDARFAVYEVNNANGNYRLEMFKPGATNPEIALTYSSFGHWTETRAIGSVDRQALSVWFSYGTRTAHRTLPNTGTAHYSAKVLGSGERFTDMARLTLSGTSSITLDFSRLRVDGTFDADARTAANTLIDLPVMTFGTDLNSYTFNTFLFDSPGHTPGSIDGSLYGPAGEEIGGSFSFHTQATPGGPADASYSGVFYGTRD